MSCLLAFSYCSWASQGKNTKVFCHFLLQWTTFCQTSPPWPDRLGWPHMAWLNFIELDKAVVRVIRLVSFLWLWFQSVCPLMPSLSTYHLTGVSLTLYVGYLFTAAPAKGSHCSWPWTWGISPQQVAAPALCSCGGTVAGGALGRSLGHLGGSLINKISAFIRIGQRAKWLSINHVKIQQEDSHM